MVRCRPGGTPAGKTASERHCVQDTGKWSVRKTLSRLSGFGAGNKDLAELRALRIGAAELDFLDSSPQKKSPSPFTQAFEVPHPLSRGHCTLPSYLLGSSMSAHPQSQPKAHAAVAWRLVLGGSTGRQAVPVPGAGLAVVQQCSAPDTVRCTAAPRLCAGKLAFVHTALCSTAFITRARVQAGMHQTRKMQTVSLLTSHDHLSACHNFDQTQLFARIHVSSFPMRAPFCTLQLRHQHATASSPSAHCQAAQTLLVCADGSILLRVLAGHPQHQLRPQPTQQAGPVCATQSLAHGGRPACRGGLHHRCAVTCRAQQHISSRLSSGKG